MTALHPTPNNSSSDLSPQKDRRRNHRIPLRIGGRYLNESSEDHGLLAINISCRGALVISTHRPSLDARIVCYFDELGRVSARVIRHTDEGFAMEFRTSQHKRDKLADKLVWLLNRDKLGLKEERASPRYATRGPAIVIREDGRELQCRVVDISLTGASFEADGPAPMIGESVKAGNLHGEVVRRTQNGFAIRYVKR
ncbi:MAG: PilZ domain-containing protein [Hyphomonadaceae bacterium]